MQGRDALTLRVALSTRVLKFDCRKKEKEMNGKRKERKGFGEARDGVQRARVTQRRSRGKA